MYPAAKCSGLPGSKIFAPVRLSKCNWKSGSSSIRVYVGNVSLRCVAFERSEPSQRAVTGENIIFGETTHGRTAEFSLPENIRFPADIFGLFHRRRRRQRSEVISSRGGVTKRSFPPFADL